MAITAPSYPLPETAPAMAPRMAFSWGAVLLAIFQSGCALLVLIQRIAVPLGLVSLASVQHHDRAIHSDALRLPILALAATAAAANLYVLWNAWRLRRRPEAAWRKKPLARREKLRNGWVLVSSLVTLALVCGELVIHPHYHPVASPSAGQHAHTTPLHRGA